MDEAVRRGHTVTAIVRNIEKLPKNDLIIPAAADVNDSAGFTKHFQGQDAVIHAYAPPPDKEVTEHVAMQRTGHQIDHLGSQENRTQTHPGCWRSRWP